MALFLTKFTTKIHSTVRHKDKRSEKTRTTLAKVHEKLQRKRKQPGSRKTTLDVRALAFREETDDAIK